RCRRLAAGRPEDPRSAAGLHARAPAPHVRRPALPPLRPTAARSPRWRPAALRGSSATRESTAASASATTAADASAESAKRSIAGDVAAKPRIRTEQPPAIRQRDHRRPRIARFQGFDQVRERIERRLLAMPLLHLAGHVAVL